MKGIKGKKASMGFALALAGILVITGAAILMEYGDISITGAVPYNPVYYVPSECYINKEACVNLNGDYVVDGKDEEIFAKILEGLEPYSSLADFDLSGDVDNEFDFQACYVPLRDYYIDIKDGKAYCNLPKDPWDGEDFEGCTNGCADLNGDGYVDDDDYAIFQNLLGNRTNETNYPGADLNIEGDSNGWITQEDKDCFVRFVGRILTCNLPTYFLHNNSCPDLTDERGVGNDGYVDDYDKQLFDDYFAAGDPIVDFNGDEEVNWLDKVIFEQYYDPGEQRIVDCNLFHAAWHIGGLHQQNTKKENKKALFGGAYNASQSFVANCQYGDECQLTRIRLHLRNTTTNISPVVVEVYNAEDSTGAPNQTYLVATTAIVPSFELNRSSWVTLRFKNPPMLTENKAYHLVVKSPENGNNTYEWYYNNVTERSITLRDASVNGENTDEWAGYAVVSGDVNKDGYKDIIVGAPNSSSQLGKIYLFYGPLNATTINAATNIEGAAAASWKGSTAREMFGYSLATGDINKDGYGDIVVGASGYNNGSHNYGAVYVIYGRSAKYTSKDQNISSEPIKTFYTGEAVNDTLGYSVAAGDIDNDGYDDIIAGAPVSKSSTNGAVYVVYGPDYTEGATIEPEEALNIVKFKGESAGDSLGMSLASGDVNSDGYDDIIAGSSAHSSNRGIIYVINGKPEFDRNNNITDFAASTWNGERAGDLAASSIATGDVNNDGYDDILIGAPGSSPSYPNRGRAYLLYGPMSVIDKVHNLSRADAIWTGESNGDLLGSAVAAGDIDGDDFEDILISAENHVSTRGALYAVYGPVRRNTGIEPIEDAWGTKWEGQANDYLGGGKQAIAAADLNKDNYDDIVLGSWNYSTARGKIDLIYSPPPRNIINGTMWNQSLGGSWTSFPDFDFLFQVWMSTACADLNRDGVADNEDDSRISAVPDNLRYSGTPGWNPKYDLNNDSKIDEEDSDMLLPYVDDPQIDLVLVTEPNSSCKGTTYGADRGFGYNISVAQRFKVPEGMSEIHNVKLALRKDTGSGVKNITVEIWDSIGAPETRTILATSQIDAVPSSSYRMYSTWFDPPASVEEGGEYYIVAMSTKSPQQDAYSWGECTSSDTTLALATGERGIEDPNVTPPLWGEWTFDDTPTETLTFQLYEGNNDSINSSLDVDDDDDVDGDDYLLVQNSEGEWGGQFLIAKIDFNALFGIYEQLKDRTLGFKAYLDKVLTCGLPTWEMGTGNGRCDYEYPYYEDYINTPEDCPPCNYDGFCASSEDFTYCTDCLWPSEIPRYSKFGCDTTDFANEPNISRVENAIIEACEYGKIELLETADFTGLSLDNDVEISYGFISVISPTLNAINKEADLTLYNLTYVHPWIVFNGARCAESRCTSLEYTQTGGTKNNFKFNVPDFGEEIYWNLKTIDQFEDKARYSSIGLDKFGRPHISYFDQDQNLLRHAFWNGLGWQRRTVISGLNTQSTSLVVDSKDQPHIVYCNSTGPLLHSQHNGIIWVKKTVDNSLASCDYATVAIDSNDNLHVAYIADGDIKYATFDGSTWTRTSFAAETGAYTSIDVDSNDNPKISFINGNTLRYFSYNGTDWEKTSLSPQLQKWTSLEISSTNKPHITYYNMTGTNRTLGYAECIASNCNSAASWNYTIIDNDADVGEYTSLALDTNNKPHVSYYDAVGTSLKYAYYNGTGWEISVVDGSAVGAVVGRYSSIDIDKYGNAYISYYNKSDGIKVASLLKRTEYDIIEAAPDISAFTGDDTTNLSIKTGIELENVTSFTVENEHGKVEFLVPVDISPRDLQRINISKFLMIAHNNVSMISSHLPMLNRPATISLYNIEMVYPNLLRNEMDCPDFACSFISYEGGTLIFNVTRFSSYSAEDTARPYFPWFLVFSFAAIAVFVLSVSIKIMKTGSRAGSKKKGDKIHG